MGSRGCILLSATRTGETQPLYTFALVTCPARQDMEWLHDRMPLIFEEGISNM